MVLRFNDCVKRSFAGFERTNVTLVTVIHSELMCQTGGVFVIIARMELTLLSNALQIFTVKQLSR